MSVKLPPLLVVDDEKNMRLSLEAVMADEGYEVRAVDSAESTALAVKALLNSNRADSRPNVPSASQASRSALKFFVTDSTEKFSRFGKIFLDREITNIVHVDLKE